MSQPASTAPGDPLVGQVLSQRYRILAKLGEGAMAAVYLAEHTVVGTNIVLKVLLPELADKPDLVDRFLQEAKIASEIHHDNIIDIFYSGRSPEGHVFLAMEYLPGATLYELLEKGGPMRWGRAQPILRQIAEALEAAHGQGVIHRDVKPENVLVVEREKPNGGTSEFVKVVDFGIANVGGGVGGQGVCGTPEYMAPEQARAQPPDLRDDIYAFGCLMYQVVTGDVPFTAPSIQKVLLMHMQQPVEPPRRRRPDLEIPVGAEAIAMRALEKTRDRRFQNMAEVVAAIAAVPIPRRMTPPPMTTTSSLPGGRAVAAPAASPRLVFEMPEPRSRRRKRLALGAAVVLLFGVAASIGHKRKPLGHLEITVVPADAQIYVDGQKMAERSPLALDATPGRYRITGHREGCDDVTQMVDISAASAVRVPLALPVAETTRLELESDPPGARIWLDGEPMLDGEQQARTPFSAGRVPPGRHAVEMDGVPDMGAWHGRVLVTLGSSRTLRGVLPRLDHSARPRQVRATPRVHGSPRSAPVVGPVPGPTPAPSPAAPAPGAAPHGGRPPAAAPGVTFLDLESGTIQSHHDKPRP
jgi:tRNA A-37 threonylcarbamoyl transferase component Bud32